MKNTSKTFLKSSIINKFAKNWLLPSLYIPDERKKVKKIVIFRPLCRTSKGCMKTVKEFSGGQELININKPLHGYS